MIQKKQLKKTGKYYLYFLRWVVIAIIVGVAGGVIGSLFHHFIDEVTYLRSEYTWLLYLLPLIFISTILTHLTGGSAGREGAALQVGGSIGSILGKALKFNYQDINITILCGMSAVFSAMFGTPIAAAIFSMEVVMVGAIQYAALVPCIGIGSCQVCVWSYGC